MNEYLAYHQDKWWHFYIKPFYGLCFRKKEGARFSNFEVLLPEACEDFCALAAGGQIHLVCQDQSSNIIYLSLENDTWHKTILLESKASAPYPKHFLLLPVGGFINLFYTISYKEKNMLVHQIITAEDRPPAVIDRIHAGKPPFSAALHTGTDMMVLYENEDGMTGTRLYRWSRKAFGRFSPVNPNASCRVCTFLPETQGRIRYAAFQKIENITNLVYFEKTEKGTYTQPVTVYLDCPIDAAPVFCADDKKLYLVWLERGGIMSAHSTDDGVKWSKPIRYMIPAGSETVRYGISVNGLMTYAYGYTKEQDVILYATSALDHKPPAEKPRQFRPAGYEAEEFAKSQGGMPDAPAALPPDPVSLQLKQEMALLKEQFLRLRISVADLTARVESINPAGAVPLTENEEAIDDVLLKSSSSPSHSSSPNGRQAI